MDTESCTGVVACLGVLLTSPLDTALAAFFLSSALALSGFVASSAVKWVQDTRKESKLRRRMMVDLIIAARFARANAEKLFGAEQIEALKKTVARTGDDFRAYVVSVKDDSIYRDVRKFRHSFEPSEIARIDAFLDISRLVAAYYDNLGSDAFAALPVDRKHKVLDNMQALATELIAAERDMINNVASLARLSVSAKIADLSSDG